jgi:hypothetical protein
MADPSASFLRRSLPLYLLSEVTSVVFTETEIIVSATEDGTLPAELVGIRTEHL